MTDPENFRYMRGLFKLVLLFQFLTFTTIAQDYRMEINGPSQVFLNDYAGYTLSVFFGDSDLLEPLPPGTHHWYVYTGEVQSESTVDISIRWTSVGVMTVGYNYETFDNFYVASKNVRVDYPISEVPPVPFIDIHSIDVSDFAVKWGVVSWVDHYELTVATDAAFQNILPGYNNRTVTGSQHAVPASGNMRYYFRMRAVNANGMVSEYSEIKTVLTRPYPPVAIEPANVTANSFVARWNEMSGISRYSIKVSSTPDFSDHIYGNSTITGSSILITNLPPKPRYYYRVLAINDTGASDYSNAIFVNGIVTPVQDLSYVKTITPLKGIYTNPEDISESPGSAIVESEFVDGLGRTIQRVSHQSSPAFRDVVEPVIYDPHGRVALQFLPVSTGNDGWFKKDIIEQASRTYINEAAGFYSTTTDAIADDTHPYSEIVYEASPLSRPLKMFAPGQAWSSRAGNKPVQYGYLLNIHNASHPAHELVSAWKINTSGSLERAAPASGIIEPGGYYSTAQLYVRSVIDENGNESREYTDKSGRLILKKVQAVEDAILADQTHWAHTYYIYDDFGNLALVLSPEALTGMQGTNFDENLATQYKYDGSRRMTHKKIPGAGWLYMVYDERDRLVMTQDARQRPGKQWNFTKYDALNRPVITGIYTHDTEIDQAAMTGRISTDNFYETCDGNTATYGYTNTVFPTANIEVLTVNYFDNYDFVSGWGSSFDYFPNQVDAQQQEDVSYSQPSSRFAGVKGQVTGTLVKVLGQELWLKTATYYDAQYRVIQVTSEHLKGLQRLTNLYDFIGKILAVKSTYFTPAESNIVRRFEYDHAGRHLHTWHAVNGQPEVLLVKKDYNELGQLVAKKLHKTAQTDQPIAAHPAVGQPGVRYGLEIVSNQYNSAEHTYIARKTILLQHGFFASIHNNNTFKASIGYSREDAAAHNNSIEQFLQAIDYRYNIRGWLSKINDPAAVQGNDLFSLNLGYHDRSGNGGAAQYNGNISEIIWQSAGLDKQSYAYSYDPMNRLLEAKYYNATNALQNDAYNEWLGSGPQRPAYDLNGNIQNLFRKGKTGMGAFDLVDDLAYSYADGGNRLTAVTDGTPGLAGENGFKEMGATAIDYTYDENGSMKGDANKGITNIEYNHLNLPEKVSKSATDYIVYRYDAAGRKLAQQVFGTEAKQTDYIGEMVFENDVLRFINHEEGRVVMTGSAPEYQYHLKDHLGNVRLTFTASPASEEYSADFESAANSDFQNYSRNHFSLADHTDPGSTYNYSQLLTGGPNSQVGVAKSIQVFPGDQVSVEAYAKYIENGGAPANVPALAAAIINAFSAQPGGLSTEATETLNAMFSGGSLITPEMWEDAAEPKAYINYILFDMDYVPYDFGFNQVSVSAKETFACGTPADGLPPGSPCPHEPLLLHANVTKPGYIYIYLSNENPTTVDVYFDDLKVEHVKGLVVQMDDYYPFGLTFNNYRRENSIANKYKYNGIEQATDLDLNVYTADFRNLDPAIGRWWQVDPKAGDDMSVYSAMANNPILYSDPLGDTTWVYSTAGGLLHTIRDQRPNQSHFIDEAKFYEMDQNKGEGDDAYAKRMRGASAAFIGSNSVRDMELIAGASDILSLEFAFVGSIGKDKEIRLKMLDRDETNQINNVDIAKQISSAYSWEQQDGLFLFGHSHPKRAFDVVHRDAKYRSAADREKALGTPTGANYGDPVDFYNNLVEKDGDSRRTAALVLTGKGFTLYSTIPRLGPGPGPVSRHRYKTYKSK